MKTIIYFRLPTSLFLTALLLSCTVYNNPTTFHDVGGKQIPRPSKSPSGDDEPDWWQPPLTRDDGRQDPESVNTKASHPPKPAPVQIRRIKVGCDKFILPVLDDEVKISQAELDAIKNTDKKGLMNLMAAHIERMHKQTQENNRKIAEAVSKHLSSCKN